MDINYQSHHLFQYLSLIPTLFPIYQWTCTIGSLKDFGNECGLFGTAAAIKTGTFTLKAYIMALSTTYTFLAVVSAPDGRSASRTVSVTTVLKGTDYKHNPIRQCSSSAPNPFSNPDLHSQFSGPGLEITSSFINFNVGSKLIINGYISAPYAVTSEWSIYSSSGTSVKYKGYVWVRCKIFE